MKHETKIYRHICNHMHILDLDLPGSVILWLCLYPFCLHMYTWILHVFAKTSRSRNLAADIWVRLKSSSGSKGLASKPRVKKRPCKIEVYFILFTRHPQVGLYLVAHGVLHTQSDQHILTKQARPASMLFMTKSTVQLGKVTVAICFPTRFFFPLFFHSVL